MNSPQHDAPPEADNLHPRKIALQIFTNIIDKQQALDGVFDSSAEFAALSVLDRSFVRMLVTTAIRRLGQIDDLIAFAQDRPDSLKSNIIRNILRLGVTQMFFMDVPDHASVDTSVRLAEQENLERQKGFINAILRKLGREGKARLDKQDAGRLNTPEWLMKLWIEDYGLTTTAEIMNAHLTEAPLDITLKSDADHGWWGNVLKAFTLSTGTLRRITGGNIRDLEGFEKGQWWVQDAAAAIPAQLFGDVYDKPVVDMCAAPGGKTMQLAAMGAHVTAIDRSAKRLKRLEENLQRIGLESRVKIEVADACAWRPKKAVPYILLDAPCSATGTIRRHPDTPYLKSENDITRLVSLQKRLLEHAAGLLEVGGIVIYCTCSLQKIEGEKQIEEFLHNHTNFERMKITAKEIGDYEELINENGDLRILPTHLKSQGGLDGFFISRLRKIS
ncbi:MAG: 16S rRNA (cytosine(967)-C(5))-methyltransferase RsmB [Alphaproteobacteria bacterium]|nr:16S rRNA (cytosine(967)-C(5))-methyltransferase RsmB [Alphaproteobacteria bacterium]